MTWADFKTLLQDKLRYSNYSVISPGKTAADIEFGTAFDIRARLYYEQWAVDVFAVPVDKSAFTKMNLGGREQNLYDLLAMPVFDAKRVWISGSPITKYANSGEIQRTFDAVNTTAAQPACWAPVRPFTIMFHCVPDVFYSSSYVQGYGVQKVTADSEELVVPSFTCDTMAEYIAAHFMVGTADSKPGLTTLQMFNAKAFNGANAIKAQNLSYDFSGSRRGG